MSQATLLENNTIGPRSRILDTALILFTKRGYFNTSVQDIRRESGVSIGSIYHYFNGKEAIAKALFDDQITGLENSIRLIIKQHPALRERCRAIIAHLLNEAEQKPEVMQYILYARHREFMPGEKPICSSSPFEAMLNMVKEGIDKKEIHSLDPVVATASLFGGTIRLIHLRLDGVLPEPLPTYFSEAWTCAWQGVSGQSTSPALPC